MYSTSLTMRQSAKLAPFRTSSSEEMVMSIKTKSCISTGCQSARWRPISNCTNRLSTQHKTALLRSTKYCRTTTRKARPKRAQLPTSLQPQIRAQMSFWRAIKAVQASKVVWFLPKARHLTITQGRVTCFNSLITLPTTALTINKSASPTTLSANSKRQRSTLKKSWDAISQKSIAPWSSNLQTKAFKELTMPL